MEIVIAIGILNLEIVMWSLVFFFTCLGAARTPPPGRFFFLVRGMFFLHQKLVGVFFPLYNLYVRTQLNHVELYCCFTVKYISGASGPDIENV
jgi:hypothetical protein